MNAPPVLKAPEKEKKQCQTLIFDRLRQFGLQFDPQPGPETLTTPTGFDRLFPASLGSLYGRSPHGLMAAFQRPTARTKMQGLYLAGGGAHPGAGVPMAVLSARHAAEAIMTDLASTSTSPATAMPGGMLTASANAAPKQSLSSGS
jgi:1-hydroxycarotenoid 3,4-desaturase